MIDWCPIENMPLKFRDGRKVLVYDPNDPDHYFVARWEQRRGAIIPERDGWWVSCYYDSEEFPEPTLWAELTPPSDQNPERAIDE